MWEDWVIGKLVGSGGMGTVYRALNSNTGEIVAVKKIRLGLQGKTDDEDNLNEMRVQQALRHDNIVSQLDLNIDKEEQNLFQEFCDAGSFTTLQHNFGPLNEDLIRIYTLQILEGLEYLHEMKVIHRYVICSIQQRDLKPSNILIDSKGKVKLSDFGCSKIMDSSVTKNQMVESLKGSVLYMAPEQIRQELLSRKGDIWSLGCTQIELASGKQPWSECNFENMFAIMMHIGIKGATPVIPSNISPELKDFMESCLKIDPKERLAAPELQKHKFIVKDETQVLR